MKKSGKIKLIYIAGTGHCGSTLLDLIIGSAPEVFSTGELGFYNIYKDNKIYNKENPDYICTCGKDFNKCKIWQKVNTNSNFKIKKIFSLWESLKIVLFTLFPFIPFNKNKYTDDTHNLLEKLKKVINSKKTIYFLDSSKDPRRLFYLFNNKNLEIFPIFLTREAGGVAYSYSKKENLKKGKKRKSFYLTLLKWLLVNFVTGKMLKNNPDKILIKYKDFCENPENYIKLINKKLSINIPAKDFLEKVNKGTYHNIDGNVLRFNEITEIKRDNKWKTKLTKIQAIFSTIICKLYNFPQ
ncbi:MAG: hypothetical protein ACOC6Q_01705 [Patescibacteria group bacterium]